MVSRMTAPDISDVLDLAEEVANSANETFDGGEATTEVFRNVSNYIVRDLQVVQEKLPQFLNDENVSTVTSVAELLRNNLKQSQEFLDTKNVPYKARFPRNALATLKRLTNSLEYADSVLLGVLNKFGISYPERSISPRVLMFDDEKSVSFGSSLGSQSEFSLEPEELADDVALGNLIDVMHLMRCLERVVNPALPTYLSDYREKYKSSRQHKIALASSQEIEKIAVQVTAMRCSYSETRASYTERKEDESSFWRASLGNSKIAMKPELREKSLDSLIKSNIALGIMEMTLVQIFRETGEIIENLRSIRIPNSETIFLEGIISSYEALEEVLEPLEHLCALREESKHLISRVEESKVDATSEKLVDFKDGLAHLTKKLDHERTMLNRAAKRRADELVDSIEFCSHLFSAAYAINFTKKRALQASSAGDAQPSTSSDSELMAKVAEKVRAAESLASTIVSLMEQNLISQ
eukprot:TRINITY_DN51841_c0_g1_i1.p1 TRINITY_DN51841_c0_g1~~TRINITY_DN51841_c0_g1_i1.p1  ORF type:complete len:468 (+),score=115.45 TRINITY_DN51841_c0_g1_i1:27-1430(+)